MKDKSVHLIPPVAKNVNETNNHPEKRKVAAYARVSRNTKNNIPAMKPR